MSHDNFRDGSSHASFPEANPDPGRSLLIQVDAKKSDAFRTTPYSR